MKLFKKLFIFSLILLSLILFACSRVETPGGGEEIPGDAGDIDLDNFNLEFCINNCDESEPEILYTICVAECHETIAKISKDYNDCAPILDFEKDSDMHYTTCIREAGIENVEACRKVNGETFKQICFVEMGVRAQSVEPCLMIRDGDFKPLIPQLAPGTAASQTNYCIQGVASELQDLSFCESIIPIPGAEAELERKKEACKRHDL